MRQQNIRTFVLIISTVIYMLLGAAVFSALEYDEHAREREKYYLVLERFMNSYNMSIEDVDDLTRYLHKRRHFEYALDPWSFAGSVYFTSVTITTIGYGHSVPQTVKGKIFCMVYAGIGIPLNLTMFQAIGERMGVLMSMLLRKVKRAFGFKHTEVSLLQLVALGLLIWNAFLLAGAAFFAHYESWDFFHALYYFFVTLTTIGFGDMVALQEINRENHKYQKTIYVTATLVMIYIGLTIASSVINLLVMRLMELQQPKRKRRNVSWKNGPRCGQCQHGKLNGTVSNVGEDSAAECVASHTDMILHNFQDELAFASYKQLRARSHSMHSIHPYANEDFL